MTLAVTSPEFGTATEEVEVNYAGEDLVIGFNARYFLDILTQQGKSDIRIAFNDPNSPVLITGQDGTGDRAIRSEEHTSELQSLMRISYAVFFLKKKKHN